MSFQQCLVMPSNLWKDVPSLEKEEARRRKKLPKLVPRDAAGCAALARHLKILRLALHSLNVFFSKLIAISFFKENSLLGIFILQIWPKQFGCQTQFWICQGGLYYSMYRQRIAYLASQIHLMWFLGKIFLQFFKEFLFWYFFLFWYHSFSWLMKRS